MLVVVSIVSFLQLALLFKGAMLVLCWLKLLRVGAFWVIEEFGCI